MKENPACSWNETDYYNRKLMLPLDAFLCI